MAPEPRRPDGWIVTYVVEVVFVLFVVGRRLLLDGT